MTAGLEEFRALADADPAAASRILQQLRGKLFVPHDGGQADVMASAARFRVLRAGRRWGKTQLAAHEVIMAALKGEHQMVWWVANSDKNVKRGYRAVLKQLPRDLLAKAPPSENANDRILSFKNGSSIEFYTAGTPDSLAGEGVNFLVVDEAALIPENVWFQLLRPTLADTQGRALIISTPRGRNWFWKLWKRGQLPGTNYASWHFTSFDNPYIEAEEIEDARSTLPNILFQQEYMAEFLANAASMFTLPDSQVLPNVIEPSGWVMLGVDLAKKEDFTVLAGANAETRRPCVAERFNEISWPIQQDLIAEKVAELEANSHVEGVTVVVDSTGLGDVVYDELDARGLDVVGINFGSGQQKERMVRLLAADIEHLRSYILEEDRDEFESYEYNITPNGRYQFEAADGHDDRVSAKLLQNWGIVHEAPPGIQTMDVTEYEPEEAETELPAYERLAEITPDAPADIMRRPEAWG